jgi:uncharacterized membrane protein YeaQ/YmgE (transglycosylase-associated protein family)
MSFIGVLISLFISGLFVGALGRLALPGRDPMTIWQTVLVGVAGSLIGGLVGYAVGAAGWAIVTFEVLGATAIVYFIRRSRGGSFTSPGRPPVDRR